MRIEIHILQNFAPANLNRDDTGSPKDAEFGGHRRARISSQCIKRSVRQYFKGQELVPAANRGHRTKRLLDEVARRFVEKNRTEEAIRRAVSAALAGGGLKLAEDNRTQYLLFLGENELARFVEIVDTHWDVLSSESPKSSDDAGKKKSAKKEKAEAKAAVPAEIGKAVETMLYGGKAADLALFGRMLADLPDKNIPAACQVAHALSTNKIHSMEMDYYTAVDDLKPNDTAGADMIGTVEFNSACFYRYANLDLGLLHTNLQNDDELVRKTTDAFMRAFIHAIPTGKQNSFAAHNPPSLVFAVVRKGPPVSLANAFVRPVTPRGEESLVERSIAELDRYYGQVVKMYGDADRTSSAYCQLELAKISNLKDDVETVDALVKSIVDAAFGKEAK